ncbi:putative alkylated DNA repair protein alkB-like 1-like [Apostichopus japonicus]|uniref:Putative alkylated DNA repair protein alkB-like 1-like n=1 Tax=Stichopus japonicus TaxID=307972 RepID=A0A2G8L3C5_STIJA|nr:putative alkylated DNA repair protein alkB-like 1-like [Apostichopus japonicus]
MWFYHPKCGSLSSFRVNTTCGTFSYILGTQPDVCEKFEVTKREIKTGGDICSDCFGLKPPKKWQSFTLNSSPGFIFVSNPFKVGHQRYWLKRLLEDIPNPTNKSNISDGFPVSGESVWDLHCKRYPSGKKSAFSQLRWVTLGYHYNWSTKLYDPKDVSPFPEDIGILSAIVATSLGFHNFKAEAAIVNYYNMNSTLGGHNDHSELDHDAPLISFRRNNESGQTDSNTASSGDVIILSSSSRLAFHGVPRILHDNPEYLKLCWGKTEEVDQRNENIPSDRKRDGQEDTEILNKHKTNEECKVRTGCNIEGNDNLTSRERQEESEIILTEGKMFNDRLPCTTVEELNVERNHFQSRLCRRQKENCSDDESHQIAQVREVNDLDESPNRTEQRKEKLEVTEGDEAMGINCTESRKQRSVNHKDSEM